MKIIRQILQSLKNSGRPPEIGQRRSSTTSEPGQDPLTSKPQPANASQRQARWFGPDESVIVAGRNIGGMVYAGLTPKKREAGYTRPPKPLIVPNLPVSNNNPDIEGNSFSYYPNYSEIPPAARAAYLDWLASGRSDPQYAIGYIFLYFYGIERRFFTEEPPEAEKLALIAEAERLIQIYGWNRSVKGYLGTFVNVARATMGDVDIQKQSTSADNGELRQPQCSILLGKMAQAGQPLDSRTLLDWYRLDQRNQITPAMLKILPEFEATFTSLFNEQFPHGMPFSNKGNQTLSITYNAASTDFTANFKTGVPDVHSMDPTGAELVEAGKIASTVSQSLAAYSRLISRQPEERGKVKAHSLLPPEIQRMFPSEAMNRLESWTIGKIQSGGIAQITEVIELVKGEPAVKLT